MKLGSLFDGSGGFPLAGAMCGVTPIWASEVEPYPIAVTKTRFPNMKHYGNVCALNGAKVEPVDIITFGSPCQDLSVAGKRAGLRHEENGDEETTRSGLFMEAVRIIKEMREATNGKYPTFALWENVPGAFSSNKGEDFRTVLQELIKIVEPSAVMPAVPKNGWPYADSYCGDGWSLAYRVFDAQYWGVPQRRRRIHLILDLRGERARKVLFEREGVRGYFAEGRTPWQSIATDAQDCTREDDREGAVAYTLKIRSGCEGGGKGALIQEDKSATLATSNDQYLFQPMSVRDENWANAEKRNALRANESRSSHAIVRPIPNLLLDDQGGQQINVRMDDKAPTLRAEAHGNVPAVVCYDARGNGDGETVNTITGDHENRITDYTSVVVDARYEDAYAIQGSMIGRADENGPQGDGVNENVSFTLNTKDRHAVAYWDGTQTCGTLTANNAGGNQRMPDKENFNCIIEKTCSRNRYIPAVAHLASGKETVGTLMANAGTKLWLGNQEAFSGDYHIIEEQAVRYIVRRLTPTECARLQGFPDTWGHIDHKDDFTDEEYAFWTEVRATHAAINGKEPKTYSKEQMLAWYNKLHTDSAEYKMWGNGIALPPALYVMQGMAETEMIGGAQ